jgi:hypothetical protein
MITRKKAVSRFKVQEGGFHSSQRYLKIITAKFASFHTTRHRANQAKGYLDAVIIYYVRQKP